MRLTAALATAPPPTHCGDAEYIDSEMLGFCGSLIEIRPPSSSASLDPNLALSTVHLTHFSAREFLIPVLRLQVSPGSIHVACEETKAEAESAEDNTLAKLCLHYIKFPRMWEDHQVTDTTTLPYAFRQYAAGFWWRHYSYGRIDEAARNLVEAFFHCGNPVWDTWAKWYESMQFSGLLTWARR